MPANWSKTALAFLALSLAVLVVVFPQAVFTATRQGLETWWMVVVPSLFPFFLASRLLLGLGVVHFLGVLLESLMRPLFNLPGAAALAVAVGYSTGAPVAAALAADLRRQGLCTRLEAERLVAFTTNASPLFLLGAVAVGFFHNPSLGPALAVSHYLANLLNGLWLRWYGRQDREALPARPTGGSLLRRAWLALRQAQERDPQPLGRLLGEAITSAFETLVVVGGFIILCASLLAILRQIGLLDGLSRLLGLLATTLGLPAASGEALATGLWEMTLGSQAASQAPLDFLERARATTLILGWAGLSVHFQVMNVVSQTDIRLGPFFLARVLQGLVSSFLVLPLMGKALALPTATGPLPVGAGSATWWLALNTSLLLFAAWLGLALAGALALEVGGRLRVFWWRFRPF